MESQQQQMENQSANDFNDAMGTQPTIVSANACITPPVFEIHGREVVKLLVEKTLLPVHLLKCKWISLKDKDRARAVKEFLNLTVLEQSQLLIAVEKEISMANSVIDCTGTQSARPAPSHPILNPNTTKHDKARFIEMFADPALVALWTEAFSPFEDRATLDDRFSLN